jgi:hypothetical protein
LREEFSEDDRQLLADCLSGLTSALEALARDLVGKSKMPARSPMNVHLGSKVNVPSYGGFPIVREVLVDAMYATISGLDHAHSWVTLLLEGTATVSMAAVTRGALEGLAKAHYLISAETSEELIQRHLASVRFDLVHPLKHSQFIDATGVLIDKGEFPKVHDTIEQSLGLARIARPGSQVLVQELLTAGMRPGLEASREIYSQLSGPAHAGMSALGMYVVPNTANFELPRIIAAEQSGYLFASIGAVAEGWLNLFGASALSRRAWTSTRLKAEHSMARVINWY